MNRLMLGAILLGVLGVGIALGSNGRAVVDSAQTLVAAAPTATATARPAPTAAPTAVPKPTATQVAVPRDLVIEVAEADLNAQLETLLVGHSLGTTPIGDATIRSVKIGLQDGQVTLGGGASVGPLSAPFAVAGRVAPDAAGRPLVTLTGAQVAGFLLPDAVTTGLGQLLQQQLDQAFALQTMRVRSVDIADGRIRIVAAPGS